MILVIYAGQRLWKYTTSRRTSGRWRGLPAKGVRRRLTITVRAKPLLASTEPAQHKSLAHAHESFSCTAAQPDKRATQRVCESALGAPQPTQLDVVRVTRRRESPDDQRQGFAALQALLFGVLFLLALAYVSVTDVRAGGATAGGDERAGPGNLGLRMLSSLGIGTVSGGSHQERALIMPVREAWKQCCDPSYCSPTSRWMHTI